MKHNHWINYFLFWRCSESWSLWEQRKLRGKEQIFPIKLHSLHKLMSSDWCVFPVVGICSLHRSMWSWLSAAVYVPHVLKIRKFKSFYSCKFWIFLEALRWNDDRFYLQSFVLYQTDILSIYLTVAEMWMLLWTLIYSLHLSLTYCWLVL